MEENQDYKCVNCGEPATALYKIYGLSVLKLTKCDKCKGVVDKYIQYDNVVVMVDLALITREAQRHVLYNTKFQIFWKLIIFLIMVETYAVWQSDSLFNIFVNTVCDIQDHSPQNYRNLNLEMKFDLTDPWKRDCKGWALEEKGVDLFIWEKDFYIQFISTFVGNMLYVGGIYILMKFMKKFITVKEVSVLLLVKGYTLAYAATGLVLPALGWRSADSLEARATHYILVFVYFCAVLYNILIVLYECPRAVTLLVVLVGHAAKYEAIFHGTPFLRRMLY